MKLNLNATDWGKVIKGALIAGGGAALTYLSSWASGTEFGVWTPVVVAGLSVLVNYLRKAGGGTPAVDE
jgi:hypothetical protein